MAVERAARAAQPSAAVATGYLREQLGERLTAIIAGVTDASIIRAWASDEASPTPKTKRTLRAAYEVTRMLREVDSADAVRSWFGGMNAELDDEAPALMIAKDPARVLSAARFYVAHG
jgi:hypothetical protein